MKLFKKLTATILFTLLTTQCVAEEDFAISNPPIILDEKASQPQSLNETLPLIAHKKIFLYGSYSLFPGGGISYRKRQSNIGRTIDFKLGKSHADFDHLLQPYKPIISADYNFCYYIQPKETSFYLLGGIGAACIFIAPEPAPIPIPYLPLRAGIEFKNGFMDLGAKMVLGFILVPEARAGVNFTF